MPTVGLRNTDSQQIGSADHLDVEDRNWSAEWYDSGFFGSAYIAAIVVPLITTRQNSAPEIFSLASSILTILEAGIYFFNYTVMASPTTGVDAQGYGYIEEDPATGTFAQLPGTMAAAASTLGSATSIHTNCILRVGINYRYRLMAASAGTNWNLLGSGLGNGWGSRLSVIRLFKNG